MDWFPEFNTNDYQRVLCVADDVPPDTITFFAKAENGGIKIISCKNGLVVPWDV